MLYYWTLTLYTPTFSFVLISSIADCCPKGNSCVIMGGVPAELTTFPREAMYSLKPYPFGVDPVSC